MAWVFRRPHWYGPRRRKVVGTAPQPIILAGGVATAFFAGVTGTVTLPTVGSSLPANIAKHRVAQRAADEVFRPTWTRDPRRRIATVPQPIVLTGGVATAFFAGVTGTVTLPSAAGVPTPALIEHRRRVHAATRDVFRPVWTRDPRRFVQTIPQPIVLTGGVATAFFAGVTGTVTLPAAAEAATPALIEHRRRVLAASREVFRPTWKPYRRVQAPPISPQPIVLTGGVAQAFFAGVTGTVTLPAIASVDVSSLLEQRRRALVSTREVFRPTWVRDPRRSIITVPQPIVLTGGVATAFFAGVAGTVTLPAAAEATTPALIEQRRRVLIATRDTFRPTWVRDPRRFVTTVAVPIVLTGGVATAFFAGVTGTVTLPAADVRIVRVSNPQIGECVVLSGETLSENVVLTNETFGDSVIVQNPTVSGEGES